MRRLTETERAEREVIKAQHYAELRAEREAKRTQNKDRWRQDDDRNANVRAAREREACAPEIAEPAPSNSLDQLKAIMDDPQTPVGLRIDSAESLLAFQTAPGSLTNPAVAEHAAGTAYVFLKGLAATKIAQPLQVKVLRLLANCEATRASRTDPTAAAEQRERYRQQINAARRLELIRCGVWQRVCLNAEPWELRADDQFELPTPAAGPHPPPAWRLGDQLSQALGLPAHERERRHTERRQRLLGVRASGRSDDWRDLIRDAAN